MLLILLSQPQLQVGGTHLAVYAHYPSQPCCCIPSTSTQLGFLWTVMVPPIPEDPRKTKICKCKRYCARGAWVNGAKVSRWSLSKQTLNTCSCYIARALCKAEWLNDLANEKYRDLSSKDQEKAFKESGHWKNADKKVSIPSYWMRESDCVNISSSGNSGRTKLAGRWCVVSLIALQL